MVVAQLAELSLPTTEIRGLIPNIGKILKRICQLSIKVENKDEEAKKGSIKKES